MDLHEFGRKLDGYRESVDGTAAPAAGSRGNKAAGLEPACDELIRRLHHLLDRLARHQMRRNQRGSLETAKELLVEVIDFVTQRLGGHAVASDLSRICDLRDTIGDLQSLTDGQFWRRVFRMKTSHNDLREQALRRVGVDFVDVFRNLLSLVDGHLPSVSQ